MMKQMQTAVILLHAAPCHAAVLDRSFTTLLSLGHALYTRRKMVGKATFTSYIRNKSAHFNSTNFRSVNKSGDFPMLSQAF